MSDAESGTDRGCGMPECTAPPEREIHSVRGPDGKLLDMCEGCLNDGWDVHVEVLD